MGQQAEMFAPETAPVKGGPPFHRWTGSSSSSAHCVQEPA